MVWAHVRLLSAAVIGAFALIFGMLHTRLLDRAHALTGVSESSSLAIETGAACVANVAAAEEEIYFVGCGGMF